MLVVLSENTAGSRNRSWGLLEQGNGKMKTMIQAGMLDSTEAEGLRACSKEMMPSGGVG